MTDRALASAVAIGHPVRLTRALLWAFAVYAWSGHAESYEEHAERIIQESSKHDLGPFQIIGSAIKGVVRVAQGRSEEGLLLLRQSSGRIEDHRFGPVTDFGIHLAEVLAKMGHGGEALDVINDTLARARRFHYLLKTPDMQRVKAELLTSAQPSAAAQAERLLNESLDLAQQHSARGWELRTAISLTRLLLRQERCDEARR